MVGIFHKNGGPSKATMFFVVVLDSPFSLILAIILCALSLHLLPHPPLRSVHKSRPPHLRPPLLLSMSTTSDPAPQSSPTKTVRVVMKGRVQGVFYRDWTVENATQLGLKGWVRNKRDGSLEALFSGDPGKVQEMEQRCRRGPPSALVTGLQSFPCSDGGVGVGGRLVFVYVGRLNCAWQIPLYTSPF